MTQNLDQILSARRSLRSFSEQRISPESLQSLFEAARWASSAFNEQPWHYVVLDRPGDAIRDRVLDSMEPHNRDWARKAPVILASIAQLGFRARDGANRHAIHDVGQANAHLALRAAELGLTVHQIGGFSHQRAATALNLPAGYEVVVLMAIAYPGSPEALPEALRVREVAPRVRRTLDEFVHHGNWP